jgi:DNA-binding CsgD family transcriptional regulator
VRRAERALAAAEAKYHAGALDVALGLVAIADSGLLTEFQCAHVDVLRAQIAFAVNRGRDAPPLLLKAAKRLEFLDARLARETYLDALTAAVLAHRLATGVGLLQVADAVRASPPVRSPRASDLLLDGWVLLITEGYEAGTPMLKRALRAFRSQSVPRDEEIRWLWLACHTAYELWDDETWRLFSERLVELAREAGALAALPIALDALSSWTLFAGDFARAASLVEEGQAITEVTGSYPTAYGPVLLAACQGREDRATALIASSSQEVARRGEGMGLAVIQWASAILHNGLGRYEDALTAARQASEDPHDPPRALPELIEAATRCGVPEDAADALERLSKTTQASGTDWGLGTEACSRALLSDGDAAERLYRESIERLGRTGVRLALARAHLLYGEWLRRARRRLDAREELRHAHQLFTDFGTEAFAERARVELVATGEHARKRSVETRDVLTAQEAQISRLAADDATNQEIAAQLFISPNTVDYHLRKAFRKLGVKSRHQLKEQLL